MSAAFGDDDDLLTELREAAADPATDGLAQVLLKAAADEIERLRSGLLDQEDRLIEAEQRVRMASEY